MEIKFGWDAVKAASNKKKHKISFEEAQTVFFDRNAILIHDPDHSHNEERFVILGMSSVARLLVICHCFRQKDSRIRIISARKATRKESTNYHGGGL